MNEVPILTPGEIIHERPFTDPVRIEYDLNTMRFMVDQLCLFLDNEHLYADQTPPIIVHLPSRKNWFYRLVIAKPDILLSPRELAFVGFMGHRQKNANMKLASQFDETLVSEIPQYPGLLSYSTMALVSGDYCNLVVFSDSSVKKEWSKSLAHQEAVKQLSPDYYKCIKLYNGYLPGGLTDSGAIQLTRVKYFDYQGNPLWHAVREFPKGS